MMLVFDQPLDDVSDAVDIRFENSDAFVAFPGGSGTVQEASGDPRQLKLGDKFGMKMKWGVPYSVKSTVKEFEQDRLIAWAHFGGHRWRYELEPLDDHRTRVTETFDWSTSKTPWALEWMNIPEGHVDSVEGTLERLEAVVTP